MPKDQKSEIHLREIHLSRRDITAEQGRNLMRSASVAVPGGLRVELGAITGASTVEADINFEAESPPDLTLRAIVRVRLTRKGDLRVASPQVNKRITLRMRELAQAYCLEAVIRRIGVAPKRPPGRPARK